MAADDPTRTPLANDGRPPEPSSAQPSTGAEVGFHVLGGVILLGAMAIAAGYSFFVFWGASVCQADPTDPRFVGALRKDLFLVFCAVAAVPAGWAVLCKLTRTAWILWSLISAAILTIGIVYVLSIDTVGTWCF